MARLPQYLVLDYFHLFLQCLRRHLFHILKYFLVHYIVETLMRSLIRITGLFLKHFARQVKLSTDLVCKVA